MPESSAETHCVPNSVHDSAHISHGVASVIDSKSGAAANVLYRPLTTRYPERVALEDIEIRSSRAIFDDVDTAVAMCAKAQEEYARTSNLNTRRHLIQVIRDVCSQFSDDFAWCTWSETGLGTFDAKSTMQKVATRDTPGVEDLHVASSIADDGMAVIDMAPLGVIASVTSAEYPTATIVHNSITLLAGGNGVVFHPHPDARRCSNRAVAIINEAIVMAGGPECLVTSVKEATISSSNQLMTHPAVALNLVTGGAEVVKTCLASGKRSVCAGRGNPPVVVDESADIDWAAKQIVAGASFDNNVLSSSEKEVFVVESVTNALISGLKRNGAYLLTQIQTEALTRLLFPTGMPSPVTSGYVDRSLVGLDARRLLHKIGVEGHVEDVKLIILEVHEEHPLLWTEQMIPVLPIVSAGSFDKALALAKRYEQGYRHTSSCFTQNLGHMSMAAKIMDTSIFVANGSLAANLAAGERSSFVFGITGATGIIRPSTFVRERKIVCSGPLRCF